MEMIEIKEPSILGQLIRQHRKQTGLSRIALANLAGVGKTAIFDIEKGKETVQINTLLKVMTALNIKINISGPFIASGEKSNA